MHTQDIDFSGKDLPVCELLLNTCSLTQRGFTQPASRTYVGQR